MLSLFWRHCGLKRIGNPIPVNLLLKHLYEKLKLKTHSWLRGLSLLSSRSPNLDKIPESKTYALVAVVHEHIQKHFKVGGEGKGVGVVVVVVGVGAESFGPVNNNVNE